MRHRREDSSAHRLRDLVAGMPGKSGIIEPKTKDGGAERIRR
jgi:hypothetical protein